MQKIVLPNTNCPQNDSSENDSYVGVQTFMWMTENNLVEVSCSQECLLERILSPSNLNTAYKRVVQNGGIGGVDDLVTDDLLLYLRSHKNELISSLIDGSYRPNPVLRVEIPKDNGKKRQLGIPTVVDRLIQQAISQVLSPLYEREFSDNSYGFRPKRGSHQALRKSQSYITSSYK